MAGQQFNSLREKLPTDWQDLDKVLEEIGVTPLIILSGVLSIAQNAEKDRDRLKAWDMLAKFAGIKPPERVFVTGYDGLKLTFGSTDDA